MDFSVACSHHQRLMRIAMRQPASRRAFLLGGVAAAATSAAAGPLAAASRVSEPDFSVVLPEGVLQIFAVTDRAFRVRFVPESNARSAPPSDILLPTRAPRPTRRRQGDITRLILPHITCEIDAASTVRFFDARGRLLLAETAEGRRLEPGRLGEETIHIAEQRFESPADERLFGTGCFQDGALDLRALPRRLTQVNTQISLPFMLSSKGYGLLWHNRGMAELNPPPHRAVLTKGAAGEARTADVTTTAGNARVERRLTAFEGEIRVEQAGRQAFLLDIGQKMASIHHVEISDQVMVDFANLWLPPTTSFLADLPAGTHKVKVLANDSDAPVLHHGPAVAATTWRAPVATAIDYVVIAGPSAAEVMTGYRQLLGATSMLPRWAYGYIHCRERFHSSDEILETLDEFRRRKLPVDVIVQDWQYWGKYGWNAMRFDEDHYPDPAGLMRALHARNARFMLSVWSKVGKDTDLGRQVAAKGYYIPGTEWIDFFNPEAVAFYRAQHDQHLGKLGIDAWWQDATEPENDDLVGRMTAAGRGEHVRLAYPLEVTRAVHDERRRAEPNVRPMILTRSAFLGQQRYAAATWSGDIGNGWDTLARQIPAGLNMAAAGHAYWTVDAGGFFRPGEGQYTDPGYHERFLRWFQYATFLPLQRVHGYQTNTEFWRYGEAVETVARQYLELRYRLHPYLYSLAGEASQSGVPIMRPFVFDFPQDADALAEKHSYMFGPALHVAPVVAGGADQWPVYLPRTPGGWTDLWTGQRREGGRRHEVTTPIEQLPLHGRAGAILPMGPVMQSTAQTTGAAIDLFVFPGADGAFQLYEDDGLSNAYERGAFSTIAMRWNDAKRELVIEAAQGRFGGAPSQRRFDLHLVGPDDTPLRPSRGVAVNYHGAAVRQRLG
ncbi:glycoside hydrolase family 31 protein [Caulobacter rhizosphaerae]|jgi:alpha-D-xyloside xylohydrolase|uniref:glycoside hydrolase family 31 protein n=2 Tax=Caulobacter rhizosphaerae TaxID=2010972 RepID=UPI001E4239F4|nr:TIM-barrel domain-containing protein [Caulobacter rhizosphaerae]